MIGIIILNYRNWEDTKSCIESICENPPKEDYRIILIDNASGSLPAYDLPSFLNKYGIVWIQNMQNMGYNGGNNRGIAKAMELQCSHILISNNDVRYFPGTIQTLKNYLDRHPQVGIVGPKILNVNGQVQKSNLCQKTGMKEKYLVRTRANMIFRKSSRMYFGYDRDYNCIFPVYAVLGCCFMMSRRCAEAVTPFDEHPFLYEEELILGIRMEEEGFRTVYDPEAVVEHRHGGSTKYERAFAFAHNVRSEIYYCRRYLKASRRQIYPLYCYRVVLYLLRCVIDQDFRKNWQWFLKMSKEELTVRYDKGVKQP